MAPTSPIRFTLPVRSRNFLTLTHRFKGVIGGEEVIEFEYQLPRSKTEEETEEDEEETEEDEDEDEDKDEDEEVHGIEEGEGQEIAEGIVEGRVLKAVTLLSFFRYSL
jgi:hypothetical protein